MFHLGSLIIILAVFFQGPSAFAKVSRKDLQNLVLQLSPKIRYQSLEPGTKKDQVLSTYSGKLQKKKEAYIYRSPSEIAVWIPNEEGNIQDLLLNFRGRSPRVGRTEKKIIDSKKYDPKKDDKLGNQMYRIGKNISYSVQTYNGVRRITRLRLGPSYWKAK